MEDNSPESITKNIKRAINHLDLKEISVNAREFVEKEFAFQIVVKRYKKILESVKLT